MIRPLRRLWHGIMGRIAGREQIATLTRLFALVGKPGWTTPALLGLGLLASFAETIGITLILLFLYLALGQSGAEVGGMAGRVLDQLAVWFGSSVWLAGAILVMIIARALIAYAYTRLSSAVGEQISQNARDIVHSQYLNVEYGYLQGKEQAELMETLGTETWLASRAYISWTRLMINGCSILVFMLALLFLSWKITLVAILGSGTISLIARRFSRNARTLGAEVRAVQRELGAHMLMTLQGMRTIRAYGLEPDHDRRFRDASARARAASFRQDQMTAWLTPATEVGYLAILCLIVGGVGWWGVGFAITLGAVVLLYRMQPHVRELEGNLLYLRQIDPQLQSLRAMIERDDKVFPQAGTEPFAGLNQAIRFDNVGFTYPRGDNPVLNGVSFTIPAGRTTALVGASGAGKTTIVNLLLRLYEPSSGDIRIDGTPLSQVRRDQWLERLAVAGQDVDLVEGTVIDNIRMADTDADMDRVLAASRAAGVAEFIEPLPCGYDSWIGQEGLRFSGGQRQRIGLARALLREADFMILDEATSALDHALEERIRAEVDTAMAGRTVIVITHRLHMIRHVDHIVWIENGVLRAEGSPAELADRILSMNAQPVDGAAATVQHDGL